MKIGRRQVLLSLGIAPIAASVGATSVHGFIRGGRDEFVYCGRWHCLWMGWISPVNQYVNIGRWVAIDITKKTQDGCWSANTMGTTEFIGDLQTIDTTLRPGWSAVTPADEYFQADIKPKLRIKAMMSLLGALDADARGDFDEQRKRGVWRVVYEPQ